MLLVIAITFGTINVVGGFLVTDRMLGMFKSKPDPQKPPRRPRTRSSDGGMTSATDVDQRSLYIVAFMLLHHRPAACCAGRATAVRGNQIAAVGMAIAVVATLLAARRSATGALIVLGVGASAPRSASRARAA